MSRAIIGGVVAAVILVLTAIAYFLTTSTLEQRTENEARERVALAEWALMQNGSLEGLGILKRVEALAAEPELVRALTLKDKERAQVADLAFRRYLQVSESRTTPDILALTDVTGDLVVQLDLPNPLASKWKDDAGEIEYPAIALALSERVITSDVLEFEKEGLMRVGVAPIIDVETDEVRGALVMAYSMTASQAREKRDIVGAHVAYFFEGRVFATSFSRGDAEDAEMQGQLNAALGKDDVAKLVADPSGGVAIAQRGVAGETYLVTAGTWARFSSRPLPDDYPSPMVGAMVLVSLDEAMAPLGKVKVVILLLGVGAFLLALLAMALAAKRILAQADRIEMGISEISNNGNLDYVFEPVGAELDGMANALNVMLARLLGRPEPGEEEFDEEGHLIQAGPVDFDTNATEMSEKDAEAMALAREPELDYYERLYGEYIAARRQLGDNVDGITQENFVAKLHINENKLKAKYKCRAVRFKVVVGDDKVTLKPVPIH